MSDTGNTDGGGEGSSGNWFGGRRWTGVFAVGMLVVLGVCVAVVLLGRRHAHHTGSAPAAASTSTPAPVSTPAHSPSSSPAAPLPTAVPTAPPAGVSWALFDRVGLPSSPALGPKHVDGAIATGYAHSPAGALIADVQISYRYFLAGDKQWRRAAMAMLAPGAGRAAWLRTRAQYSGGAGSTENGAGSQFTQVTGFNFVSYTPTDAVIQIAVRDAQGNLGAETEHVTWLDGDWRFVPGPDGGQAANIQAIPDLTGFVTWGGV